MLLEGSTHTALLRLLSSQLHAIRRFTGRLSLSRFLRRLRHIALSSGYAAGFGQAVRGPVCCAESNRNRSNRPQLSSCLQQHDDLTGFYACYSLHFAGEAFEPPGSHDLPPRISAANSSGRHIPGLLCPVSRITMKGGKKKGKNFLLLFIIPQYIDLSSFKSLYFVCF